MDKEQLIMDNEPPGLQWIMDDPGPIFSDPAIFRASTSHS
jgi:hypothetical protein